MPVALGTRLGPYEVTARIGAGGMGEVYRAIDTVLGRDVAIKVLSAPLARDVERVARFEREATVLASLNHHNIATIHSFERLGDRRALVMELVEGPTLADRLAQGQIRVDESVRIAGQVADALEAAHSQGIVHRDLKPANIKLRPDGVVKVLDFGLAKPMETLGQSHLNPSSSPTITTAAATLPGIVLGTPAYMAPEQARGGPVDKRADIWAFACVRYEMLTGTRAFGGEDVAETLAAVMKSEPSYDALPPDVPGAIRVLLKRCFEKDPQRRVGEIVVARFVLTEHAGLASAPAACRDGRRRAAFLLIAAAAAITMLSVAFATRSLRGARETPPEMRLEISTPPTPAPFDFALSPDGRHIAFVGGEGGRRQLWVRALDRTEARPLAGTDDAALPFWSADGHSIGFFTASALYRIDVLGGAPQALANVVNARGGTWNADGSILFAPNSGPMMRISSSGGTAVSQTRLGEGQTNHRYPSFLPDGRHFLFYAQGSTQGAGLFLGSLDMQEAKRLTVSDGAGAYLPPDRVVFSSNGTLLARRLDLTRGELIGDANVLTESVAFDGAAATVGVSISHNGHIAYRSGTAGRAQLAWFDRGGKPLGTVGEAASGQRHPALSPDGARVAVTRSAGGVGDIWVLNLERGGATRLTFDSSSDLVPVWTGDGKRIAFMSNRQGVFKLYVAKSDQPAPRSFCLKRLILWCRRVGPAMGACWPITRFTR